MKFRSDGSVTGKVRKLLFIQAYAAKYGLLRYEDIIQHLPIRYRTWHRYIAELRDAGVRLEPKGGLGKNFEGYEYLGFDPVMARE